MQLAPQLKILCFWDCFQQNIDDSQQLELISFFKLTCKTRYLSTNHIQHFGQVTNTQTLQHILYEWNNNWPFDILTGGTSTNSLKHIF